MRSKYGAKFIKWVKSFCDEYQLLDREVSIIAVSGGADSLALLKTMAEICQSDAVRFKPMVLHINHQTRSEREHQADLAAIQKIVDEYGLELIYRKVYRGLWGSSNLEKVLRDERSKIYSELALKYNANIFTGHHLDDSFEWSLMQSFRSSNPKKELGIPVVNGFLRRPFLCVSKDHLKRFIRNEKLEYSEDPTNKDTRFDRNYMREHLIPKIKERYPQYLKHYVYQKNQLSRKLGLNLKKAERVKLLKYQNENGILLMRSDYHADFSSFEAEVREVIESLSSKGRGSLSLQIRKMFKALMNGKKGPLSFSGGVHAHLLKNAIYFSKNRTLGEFSFEPERSKTELAGETLI